MKTLKITAKTLCLFIFLRVLAACDVVETDADRMQPNVSLTDNQVFVLANQSAVINLQGRVVANSSVSFSVMPTSGTKGFITDLGNGFVQYHPPFGAMSGSDSFLFQAYASNTVVEQDSITIYIREAGSAPSGYYPADDYYYNFAGGTATIDVLANDYLISGNYSLSVHKPTESFPPFYGTASVVNNKIVYQPSAGYSGNDRIIYQIKSNTDPTLVGYAVVFVTSQTTCQIQLLDDEFTFAVDSTTTSYYLPVFNNDVLCEAVNYSQIKVVDEPTKGELNYNNTGYYYVVNSAWAGTAVQDTLQYQVCIDQVCRQARAVVKLE